MTRQTRRTRQRRDERGSVAIEAAIGVPAFGLFVAMIILGGRVEIANQAVDAAAYEAARAASIERTQSEARSEEHTTELQSLMRSSYAVFCLPKKKTARYTTLTTTP